MVTACAGWMAVISVVETHRSRRTSWHFFDKAARLVFARPAPRAGGGLAVYVAHPKFQFGPFSIVTAEALRVGSFGHGALAGEVLMGVMAPLVLWFLLDAARTVGAPRGGARLGVLPAFGAAFCLPIAWGYLSVYSLHLDDALAITLAIAAMWAATAVLN